MFALSSIQPIFDSIRWNHPGSEWTWEQWQWRSTPYSPKLQNYWSLTLRLFPVISRPLVGGVLARCRYTVGVLCSQNLPDSFPFLCPFHILLVHRPICEYFIYWNMFAYSFKYYLYVYDVHIKSFCICKWAGFSFC